MNTRLTAVFLDRDGTINVGAAPGEYILDPADLVLLPGAAVAIRRLNEAGVLVVVVTNQQCIGKGLLPPETLDAIHDRMHKQLRAEGAHVDAIYVCPHLAGTCDCRKPLPGLFEQALRDHPDIELRAAVMIGDADSDELAARAAGVAAVRLGDPGAEDLYAAVAKLLDESVGTQQRR